MPITSAHEPVRAVPLAARARDTLLAAIIEGELEPAEVLRETTLAAALGISRTPIREALHRLAEIDLVRIDSSHGYHVTPIEPDRLAQMIQVMAELNGMAARLAVPRLTEDDLAWFEANADRVPLFDVPLGLVPAGFQAVTLFTDRCDSDVLLETIARIRPHLLRLLRTHRAAIAQRGATMRTVGLLAALRQNDPALVGETVRSYYETVGMELLTSTPART